RTLTLGTQVKIDIKTKILSLSSSPKGYNVDKVLKALSDGNTVVSFFFIGVNVEEECILTCLVSILDKTILDATRIQFHSAGRHSRGVPECSGGVTSIFGTHFVETVDVRAPQALLQRLIDLKPETQPSLP